VWQTLRSELHPQGLEIVTVALDTAGAEAARPWIEAANPDHPSLIDQAHILDELLGVVNVPNGVWIDERGMIVRPPEPAYPRRPTSFRRHGSASQAPVEGELSPQQRRAREIRAEVRKIRIEPEAYITALRAWVANGAASRYALAPDEVTRRSHARPPEVAEAAASFELGQYLHREGQADAAIPWFRAAHRLQPDNWTYKRQAWTFVDQEQGPNDVYDGDWLSDVRTIGAENYYPPLDL
jgi:tetratricopeptide (TPR) repeat protein